MQIFSSPFAVAIFGTICVFVWLSISAIANAVRSIVKNRDEVQLKQTLVDRGMSAEEIERVVMATRPDSETCS